MIILITGAEGFLGKNLVEFLRHEYPSSELRLINRAKFTLGVMLHEIQGCDIIIHCAGVNRGNQIKIQNLNIQSILLSVIEQSGFAGLVINLSSIHAQRNTEYGIAKREIERRFIEHSRLFNYTSKSLRLPNVYGPYSRENYNTVVATFICNNLMGRKSEVSSHQLGLIYVKNVCQFIRDIFDSNDDIESVVELQPDIKISVMDLHAKITHMINASKNGYLELNTDFDKNLFRTITYFRLMHGHLKAELVSHSDDRGWFSELLHLQGIGQVSVSKTNSEITRGNHYHTKKLERFIILDGEAEVELFGFNGDNWKFHLSELSTLDIPNYYVHTLRKIGQRDLICAFWVDEYFDKANPDTFYT